MVLHPHDIGRRRTAHHPVRILDCAVFGLLRRHIRCEQSLAEHRPGIAGVAAFPDTAAGDRKKHAILIARIGRNAVDSGGVIAAAEPALALRYVPQ